MLRLKRNLLCFLFLLLSIISGRSFATMNDEYVAIPPFISEDVYSNLMLVLDYSGSMTWDAYADVCFPDSDTVYKKVYTDNGWVFSCYSPEKTYYGYFNPTLKYDYNPRKGYWYINEGGIYSGNYLNWLYMTRIDILRWILTGGKISHNGKYVVLSNGDRIKIEDVSSYNEHTGEVGGIFQKLEGKRIKPRVGLEIYYSNNGINPNYYLINPSFNYTEVINNINSISPDGWTPTGPALNVVKRFFSREFSYDPYEFSVSNNVTLEVPCSKNFVLLVSDGEWNVGVDPIVPAYKMWMEDLVPDSNLKGKQNVKIFTVAAFLSDNSEGINALKNVAVVGGFHDEDDDGVPSGYILDENLNVPLPPGCSACDSSHEPPCGSFCSLPVDNIGEWDANGDGIPDNFFSGSDPSELKKSIEKAIEEIVNSIASGTSVCALAEKGKLGNVALQAVFYPSKQYRDVTVTWVGYLYSWWLLSTVSSQDIREDTNGNLKLDLDKDLILKWVVDNSTGVLSIEAYNGTSAGGNKITTYYSFDETHPLWETGEGLLDENPQGRHIYTTNGNSMFPFDKANKGNFADCLGDSFPSCLSFDPVNNLIEYVRGKDFPGCRSRTIDNKVWKLGDIIYSTPTIVDYGNYSVAFVGANDGMLHAFRVGYVKKLFSPNQVVRLQNSKVDSGTLELGKELWAFIPKNSLPYLRFLASPDYKHIYFVDLKPYIYTYTDSSGKLHRILIGGMRLGGAVSCTESGCINPPKDTCPNPSSSSCVGLSSYFALDVTEPTNPKFLWEFTHPELGFSYSGPGVIETKDKKHYVVFASGPINYSAQYSNDNQSSLKIFILDLKKGNLVREIDTGIRKAFSGRIFSNGVDINGDGYTDYLVFGYTRQDGTGTNYKGGLIVLAGDVNGNKLYPLNSDVSNWKIKNITALGIDIPPVTSKVEFMKCFDKWYMYFGSGRWFKKNDDWEINRNILFGIPIKPDTAESDSYRYENFHYVELLTGTQDVTDESHVRNICTDAFHHVIRGWYLKLDEAGNNCLKEKTISDPTITNSNIIFFTTIQPTSDPCGFGGRSRVWGLNCATGGNMFEGCIGENGEEKYKPKIPVGSLMLQLSSGNIEKITASSFRNGSDNRATSWFVGIAPETSTPFISPTGWIGELLLWIER